MKNRSLEEIEGILTNIFPSYADELTVDKKEDEDFGYIYTLHSLFRDFLSYFSSNIESFSEKQLKEIGNFINEAVEIDDDLENAISTCFLEHLHQVKANKPIKPYLSKKAKERVHA